MSKKLKKQKAHRLVAIEICQSEIDLVIVRDSDDGNSRQVRARRVTWRKEAPSLHTEVGQKELTTALKIVATEEKLSGVPVYLALNGDFCVTRVVAGTADKVRQELRSLEERTNLYLSLGAGEKSLASHVRQIDVRHQHGWLAVTNARTLEPLLAAIDAAGLTVQLMEPSLISLCRAVHSMSGDIEAPALVVAVDERGVQLGISLQGRLLLDYRPGGRQAKDEIAATVKNHLERLQRYCDRHFGYAGGKISRLFLCGNQHDISQVASQLADFERLNVEVLEPSMMAQDWEMGEDISEGTELISALGAAMAHGLQSSERNGPNLLDRTEAGHREPLLRGLLTAAWPIAAALLVACGFAVAGYLERGQHNELQVKLDVMDVGKKRYELLQVKYMATERKLKHLQNLKRGIAQAPPHHLVGQIARSLPNDVWIEQLSISGTGRVSLNGSGYSEDGVYEFVNHLRKIPQLAQVGLEGTEPAHARAGPSIQFSITCQLADINDNDGGAE